jgi:hypothetical protein
LGARKTTPILSLEVEVFIPPIDLRFQRLMNRSREDNTVKCLGMDSSSRENRADFVSQALRVAQWMGMTAIERVVTDNFSAVTPWINPWIQVGTHKLTS